MDSTMILALVIGLLGFTIAGYVSNAKVLLIVSVGFAIALAFEFQSQGQSLIALVLAALALFNSWVAYATLFGEDAK